VKNEDGAQLKLIFVDDGAIEDENKRHEFETSSSSTLKFVLNDYAEKRGVSLRSFRFTLDNETLFLSQAGKKSLEELNMKDKDVIYVQNIMNPQETKDNGSNQKNQARRSKAKPKRHGGNSKAKKPKKKEVAVNVEKTEEELKIEVSYLQFLITTLFTVHCVYLILSLALKGPIQNSRRIAAPA